MPLSRLFPSRPSGLFLGSPEAEAECTDHSRVRLIDVYEDFHGLAPQLSYEKFILIGRKGSGKSAFAQYICAQSQSAPASPHSNPNLFCKFIRNSDFSLERVVQLGQQSDANITAEHLFEWLVYTQILQLFAFNEAVREDRSFEPLRQFLRKNTGYIDIREYELSTLVERHGFQVATEHFNRFFRTKFDKQIEAHKNRAPFYALLPHLREVIKYVLTTGSERDNQNAYILFFDDLDVGFSVREPTERDALVSLLRVLRRINNELFGHVSFPVKRTTRS
jgi:hypothetical protein